MKVSRATLLVAGDPVVRELLLALAINASRTQLTTISYASLVDNTTGTAGSALPAILTQDVKVAQSSTNLASRANFNTAIAKTNNAIAVIATFLNQSSTPLAIPKVQASGIQTLTGFNGTVATAGTAPAQDKTVTGVDGTSDSAMLRSEFNAAIVRARNNVATLTRAYNIVATALGVATIVNNSLGNSDRGLVIGAGLTAPTTVLSASVATGDLATKVAADAALLALANSLAHLMAKLANPLTHANTLDSLIPVVLVR